MGIAKWANRVSLSLTLARSPVDEKKDANVRESSCSISNGGAELEMANEDAEVQAARSPVDEKEDEEGWSGGASTAGVTAVEGEQRSEEDC